MKKKKIAASVAASPLEMLLRTLPPKATIMAAKGYRDSARQGVALIYREGGTVYHVYCSQEGGAS
jgi:hypothetical protein